MRKAVYTIAIRPRANGPVPQPSVARDVWDLLLLSIVGWLLMIIVMCL